MRMYREVKKLRIASVAGHSGSMDNFRILHTVQVKAVALDLGEPRTSLSFTFPFQSVSLCLSVSVGVSVHLSPTHRPTSWLMNTSQPFDFCAFKVPIASSLCLVLFPVYLLCPILSQNAPFCLKVSFPESESLCWQVWVQNKWDRTHERVDQRLISGAACKACVQRQVSRG